MDEFCKAIASVIPDAADRNAFLAGAIIQGAAMTANTEGHARSTPAGEDEGQRLSENDIAMAERELARYIGPLAKILVVREAADAADVPDLYQRLSVHIEKVSDKTAFLSSVRTGQRAPTTEAL